MVIRPNETITHMHTTHTHIHSRARIFLAFLLLAVFSASESILTSIPITVITIAQPWIGEPALGLVQPKVYAETAACPIPHTPNYDVDPATGNLIDKRANYLCAAALGECNQFAGRPLVRCAHVVDHSPHAAFTCVCVCILVLD